MTRLLSPAAVLLAFALPFACFDKPDGYVEDDSSGGILGEGSDGGGGSFGDGQGGDGQDGDAGTGACEDYAEAFESCVEEADLGSDTGYGDPCAGDVGEYDAYFACIAAAYSPGMCSTDDGLFAFFDEVERCAEAHGLAR